MKRILIKALAVLIIVGGLIIVLWPVQNWRLYDAKWQPIAMTQAENYCVGRVLAQNSFAMMKDDPAVDACVAESNLGNVPDVGTSQFWFCTGIQSLVSDFSNCLEQLQGYKIWALQHGGYTMDWNDSNGYPEIVNYNISKAPRSDRGDDSRNEGGRVGP